MQFLRVVKLFTICFKKNKINNNILLSINDIIILRIVQRNYSSLLFSPPFLFPNALLVRLFDDGREILVLLREASQFLQRHIVAEGRDWHVTFDRGKRGAGSVAVKYPELQIGIEERSPIYVLILEQVDEVDQKLNVDLARNDDLSNIM